MSRSFFPSEDWQFIQWLSETHADPEGLWESLFLSGLGIAAMAGALGRQGPPAHGAGRRTDRFSRASGAVEAAPGDRSTASCSFTHQSALARRAGRHPLSEVKFFAGRPALALVGNTFYMLRSAPPDDLLNAWAQQKSLPGQQVKPPPSDQTAQDPVVQRGQLGAIVRGAAARPRFTFELVDDVVRLRLLARSEQNGSLWHWNGQEWESDEPRVELCRQAAHPGRSAPGEGRPVAVPAWTGSRPNRGLWVGDASDNFLAQLAAVWPDRPEEAEYLGNPAFHRLFLAPRALAPAPRRQRQRH